jgi:DNA polymerase III epsilon subunit-like protein
LSEPLSSEQVEVYVSVDVETGGPVPDFYPLLAIGACLVEDTDERFYVELKPGERMIEAEAVRVSWPDASVQETVARLEREGVSEAEAMALFHAWVERVSKGERPVYLAFNAAFDWAFTHRAFVRLGIPDPFGYAPLDVKAFWAGRIGSSLDQTRKSKLPQELTAGLPEHTHRADEDAVRQAEIFKRMRAWKT